MSSFVTIDPIDGAQESTKYITEEEISDTCDSESVNEDMVSKTAEECVTLHQMFEERWDIFDSHSQTSSNSEETGSGSCADIKHFLFEPLNDEYI